MEGERPEARLRDRGLGGYDAPVASRAKPNDPDAQPEAAERQPATPPADRRLIWLDRMRPFRGRRDRDVTIDVTIRSLERELRAEHDAVGDVVDAWNQVAPENVRHLASIGGVVQGTLTLVVETSGASYELSRVLRDGLERTLLKRLPARVRRIKVRVKAG